MRDGRDDLRWAVRQRELRLPEPLVPLARLARNYRWSWTRGGPQLFAHLSPHGWERAGENPVRLLRDLSVAELETAAEDPGYVAELQRVAAAFDEAVDLDEAAAALQEGTIAFLCAEYAVHSSLPIYSGGLGALAGDILKEASDLRVPMAAVGLFYDQGYFHQRLDPSGQQHEYWIPTHAEDLAAVLVTDESGHPMEIGVPVEDREVAVRVWRVDVGRVPLFLLDSDVAVNTPYDRWITSRLYVSDRDLRLAQYTLLGVGGVRALEAMGLGPATIHLNEGHAALATLELARGEAAAGAPFAEAIEAARRRTVFTTHTPVPAGNETYPGEQMRAMLGSLPSELGVEPEQVLDLGRVNPGDHDEWPGMTVLGLRTSRAANGVSREHGRVARGMWHPVFGDADPEAAPIGHVTNGVHHPTWIAPAMRRLLDEHLPEGWFERADDPAVWSAVDEIPDAALWRVREELRADLIEFVRERSLRDRLGRSEPRDYVEAAARALDPGTLTLGFARRVATYKRLGLLMHDPERALALLDGPNPVQLLIAGKAHPADDAGKSLVRELFALKGAANVAQRVVFLEDYDLGIARRLVAGCDVWVNLPRPPMEASGTSGMKSAFNGGLQLSVADGWWAEAYDGTNGWSIPARTDLDEESQDQQDAETFYRLLEQEVVPTFAAREQDVPADWVRLIKASLRTVAPRFAATRMVREYQDTVYATPPPPAGA